jgi:aspartyl-tRNA(Asn)/glutamyl-tRNA(Gln) amidotransferase subunit A
MRSAVEMADAVRRRDVSPVELVEETLRRIEAWQPVTNAFSQVHGAEALAAAQAREAETARGEEVGPLHGVPVAVKDLFDVAGWETTGCCRAYQGRVAERDADVVRRLREAGAVIVGKTNQHELACGATNLISACGITKNPWDPSRITGGSSGGSGAAVAVGVVPLALGTDTGGSVRIPASMCGIAGLKTTHGRVSLDGVMPLAPSLDTVGPMARTVGDCAAAMAVLTGDSLSPDHGTPVEELRIGSLGTMYVALLQQEVLDATMAAAEVFRQLGARTIAVLGEGTFAPEVWDPVAWPELADQYGDLLQRPDLLHPRTVEILNEGLAYDEEARAAARRRVDELTEAFLGALGAADILLAAATSIVAPPAGADWVPAGAGRLSVRRGAPSLLTRSVNLVGLPALALPAGFSWDGLPIGIQLIGRPGDEATLLRAGRAFQDATEHHLQAPSLPGSGPDAEAG